METPFGSSSSLAYYRKGDIHQLEPVRKEKGKKNKANLDKDIPVSIVIPDVSVGDLILVDLPVPSNVFVDDLLVRVPSLRVLVQELHVRVGRGRVEVVVEFLNVLSVVT